MRILLIFTAALLTCLSSLASRRAASTAASSFKRCMEPSQMKQRIPVVVSFLGMGLLLAGSQWAQAQNQPMPSQSPQSMPSSQPAPQAAPQPSAQPSSQSPTQSSTTPTNSASPAASSSSGTAGSSATYNTSQGQLVVKSSVPP